MIDAPIRPAEQYRAFLEQGRFMLQRARGSGAYIFYPRVAEPRTGATDLDWVEASGRGIVYSVTVQRNRPPVPDASLALVDLAEGPRMLTRIDCIAPEQVPIGRAVRARIAHQSPRPSGRFAQNGRAA